LPSVGLVRFAKLTAVIADVSTIFCAVLIVGWQIIIFLRDGSWRALPLSLVLNASEYNHGEVTGSIDKTGGKLVTNFIDALLQVPIIVPLLLATAFLTAFYLWLSDIERRLAKM
jgi:hypothetical protein